MNLHLPRLFAIALACAALAAAAAEPLRIGYLSTTSTGPTTGVSKEARAGFDFALEQLGGSLGGLPVEVISGDDQANPDVGKQVLDRLIKRDHIALLTGPMASGVLYATAPLAVQQRVFFFNLNVGPRDLVGDKCSPYYFNTGWPIEGINEALGGHLAEQGVKKVFALGAAVPVGREHLEAFKRGYGQPLVGEIFYKLQTLDFSAELAQIRVAQPEAVYAFAFGPLAVNFVKQYAQAGLGHIPLYGPAPLADEDGVAAAGEAMLGVTTAGHWSADLPHEANKRFVAAFRSKHGRNPSMFHEQGYSTALLLHAGLSAAQGRVDDHRRLRQAFVGVQLELPRGPLRFNVDHSPVQNVYLRKVVKGEGGEMTIRTQRTIATAQTRRGAAICRTDGY